MRVSVVRTTRRTAMRRWLFQYASLIAASLLISSAPARAQQTPAGEPRAPSRLIETGSEVVRVPLAYLIGRFPSAHPNEVQHHKEFQFAFWMPDGLPTERDAGSLIGYRPKDTHHPSPSSNEYIVRVLPAQQIRRTASGYIRDEGGPFNPPSAMFSNMDGPEHFISNPKNFQVKAIDGLVGYFSHDPTFPRVSYLTQDGVRPQAFIECDTPAAKHPLPHCLANAFFPESGFAFRLQLPSDKLFEWKAIAETASQLMESWRSEARKLR